MRAIEFFCGIGGFAATFKGEIALALDQNQQALATYRHYFSHPTSYKTIGSIGNDYLSKLNADLWWASPPCQPFTIKGARRQLSDFRAQPLLQLLNHFRQIQPTFFILEHVNGFTNSPAYALLQPTIDRCGYPFQKSLQLCPTQWGIPNRRPRLFYIASKQPLNPPTPPAIIARPLHTFLEKNADPKWTLANKVLRRFRSAMDIIDANQTGAITQTFTAGYGKSPVRCGSYVHSAPRTPNKTT